MVVRPLLAAFAASLLIPAAAGAASETLGKTTLEVRILGGDRAAGYTSLRTGPGQDFVVREGVGATARAERLKKRRSFAYFAQLSDFQLADEESPARVELLDQVASEFSSAWRPQEALMPFVIDASIRQVNAHMASPVPQGNGKRAQLGYVITTGDNADNQQRNETEWVARLLEGGRVDPNSGSANPADIPPTCPAAALDPAEAAGYTGVQDYDDYVESGDYYDPDKPAGKFSGWPSYPGLMDRAQQPFDATGLRVPSYVAIGNHDALVQGNEDANAAFEAVATGCKKVMLGQFGIEDIIADPSALPFMTSPTRTALVPPDPRRAFVTLPEYRKIFKSGRQADGHGFGFVDAGELAASNGAASYYAFSPKPGLRMIALDSVANGGVAGVTDRGNIDDPQYQWLDRELAKADAAGEIAVVYSHHAPVSMDANAPDELASPCTADRPEDDPNPGCDLDPRSSEPLHLGTDMVDLLHAHPSVVAWVAGHSHVNDVTPYAKGGGGFWVVRTSAEADWPHQDRLVEIMDNRDETLSIFGTLLDNAAPITAPGPERSVGAMTPDELASLGRTFGYNDPDSGGGTGEGQADDNNVELLVSDPRDRSGVRLSIAGGPSRSLRTNRTSTLSLRLLSQRDGSRAAPLRRTTVNVDNEVLRTDRAGRVRVSLKFRKSGRKLLLVTTKGHRPARLILNVRR